MSQPLRKEQETFLPPQEDQVRGKRTKRKKSFNLSKSKLPAVAVIFLLTYLAVSFSTQFGKLSTMQKDVANIQQQVQELKQKNATLREDLLLVQSDSYIEKTAREKLGLVKPGETRVLTVPEGLKLTPVKPPENNHTVAD